MSHGVVDGDDAKPVQPGESRSDRMPLGPTNNRDATDPLVVDQSLSDASPSVPIAPGAQWNTALIGRDRDLDELEDLILNRLTHLVTITGADGMGKTRLAASLVERVAASFPAGVAFVPLANVTNREIAIWSIAEAIGVSVPRGEEIEREFQRRLTGARVLIVLDDVDTVPDLPSFLEQLLPAADRAMIVVVNERPLGIAGEHEHPLRPLDLDAGGGDHHSEAVELLLHGTSVTGEEAIPLSIAHDIARRAVGAPLALELIGAEAGARGEAFRSESIFDTLDHYLPASIAGEREAVAGAIAWSYEQLAPPLRLALRQLSVFVAGFLPDAAAAQLAGAPGGPMDGQSILDDLVARSLIVRVVYDDEQTRYWMPAVIRAFGFEQLEAANEARDACQRHAEWCQEYANVAEQGLKGADQTRWRQRVAREIGNIRSALEWLYGSGQASSALWIATALGRFWSAGPYMNEGRYWLERGLSGDVPVIDLARARALDTLSWLVLLQGDIAGSREMVTEALALFRQLGDVEGIAVTLDSLGELSLTDGDFRSAIARLDEGQRHWREIGNRWSMAMSLITLGTATLNAGQRERSRESLMKARTIMEDVGDERGVGLALLNLGWLYLHQSELGRAAPALREALVRLRSHGAALELAEGLEAAAAYAIERDDNRMAGQLYTTARSLRRDAGIQPEFLSRLGHLDDRRAYRQRFDGMSEFGSARAAIELSPPHAAMVAEEMLSQDQVSVPVSAHSSLALTPRERDVLRLLIEELPVIEIAERLGISPRMATTVTNSLYLRLGVTGRSEVAAAARHHGVLEPPGS